MQAPPEKLSSVEDEIRKVSTFRLANGMRLVVDDATLEELGLDECMRQAGLSVPTERVDVYQRNVRVGTVPACWTPESARSLRRMYTFRPLDFTRGGNGWQACWTMGPGDLGAVEGFRFV